MILLAATHFNITIFFVAEGVFAGNPILDHQEANHANNTSTCKIKHTIYK